MKHLYFAACLALVTALSFGQAPALAGGAGAHASAARVQPKLADKIAASAQCVACHLNTVGWCYHGVKQALNRVGIALSGTAAWMAKTQLMKDPRFEEVPIKTLKKGDILVHGRSEAHPYGHIAVYLGHDQEASDHVQKLVTGGRYGQTVVFRPVGPHAKKPVQSALAYCPVKRDRHTLARARYARTRNKRRSEGGRLLVRRRVRATRHAVPYRHALRRCHHSHR